MALETEDLLAVDILRSGGPFHGIGSPPAGDHLTDEDLESMARAFTELRDELRVPVKLGHEPGQRLLAELAAGWVDGVRVEGGKLLADLRRVPKLVADLIRAGAFRTRSSEFGPYTSQRSGKTYPIALKGLALLGASLPAVKTLSDIVTLYGEAPDEGFVAELVSDDPVAVEIARRLKIPIDEVI